MADRPVVRICDRFWEPLGELSSFDNLMVILRSCDVGRGSLEVQSPTAEDREYLSRGHGIQIVENGRVLQSGLLDQLGEAASESGTVAKPTWLDLNVYLRRAELYANPASESGQGPATHDVRGGFTSSAVLGFVDANIGPSALPRRRAPGVVMAGDPQAGLWLSQPAAARFDNALEFLKSLALSGGCVFEFSTEDRTHTFTVRQIADRSADVQYSSALNNLGAGSWTVSAPQATEAKVYGPGEGTEQMIFRVQTAQAVAEEAAWGPMGPAILSASSLMTDETAKAFAAAEGENLKVWVSAFKDGLKNLTDAYKKADRLIRDLDLRLGEKYIGPVTGEAILAERQLVIDVIDGIGLQIAIFDGIDIDTNKDLTPEQEAALIEMKRHRDGFQMGGTDTPGHSIINGISGAIDALHRVQAEFPTDFNLEQQVALDGAKEVLAFLGAKFDLFFATRPVVAEYRQKALDSLAAAVVANRDLTFHTLYARAEQLLAEKGESVELTYEIDAAGSFEFGRDVFISDLVSVWPEGAPGPFVKSIREAQITWSVSGGRNVKLTVGDFDATSFAGEDVAMRQIISTVRGLQTRR